MLTACLLESGFPAVCYDAAAHTRLKLLRKQGEKGTQINNLVPGAGLEPARTLPGPRDFKSRVSTNSTIRAQAVILAKNFGETKRKLLTQF